MTPSCLRRLGPPLEDFILCVDRWQFLGKLASEAEHLIVSRIWTLRQLAGR